MRFRMSDDTVVDTKNASKHWTEGTDWDGHNEISRATGDQWCHQMLFRSRKGRYYIIHFSQWEGSQDSAEWVSHEEAARWLLHVCEMDVAALPEDLAGLVDQLTE